MSTPRQILAEKIRSAATKKRAAADALVTARNTGEGPLFSEAQIGIMAAVCKQTGTDPTEFVATCTAKIRPTLPSKATGEELLVFIEKAVEKIQEQSRPKPSFNQSAGGRSKPAFSRENPEAKSNVKVKLKPLVC